MPRPVCNAIRFACYGLLTLLPLSIPSLAETGNGLTTIDNPGGGQVVFGPMTNVTSQRDAFAAMLRYVHNHFGDKPQIGKLFQSKGSDSIAIFFELTAKNQGNKPVAGMVIVDLPQGSKTGTAAVLYDDAARFGKTQPALMQKLNAAWHVENAKLVSAARASGGSTSSNSPRSATGTNVRGNGPGGVFGTNEPATSSLPLHLARNGDNSGSIGLPSGWHVTGGSGGSLAAEGPQGESIAMGVINQNIYDPRTHQSMISYMSKGSVPFSVCAYSTNLEADYMCVSTQQRRRQNKPPITMHVLSTRTNPGHPEQGAMLAEMDFHNGKGVMLSSIHAVAARPGGAGWTLSIDQVNVPKDIADGEWSTIAGMIMTYRQNSAVISQETQAVIDTINRTAEANRKLAQVKSDANDAHNKQVEDNWDVQAKENKAFENYTLDRAVVQDNDIPAHGTFTYPTADWLVKTDPTRFQYVATQDLLKGIDY